MYALIVYARLVVDLVAAYACLAVAYACLAVAYARLAVAYACLAVAEVVVARFAALRTVDVIV